MFRATILALVLCLTLAPRAQAQNLDPITAARLSAQLFEVASISRDPLLMVAAAKLRKQVAVDTVTREPERDGDAPADVALDQPATWQDMLAAATEAAGDDPQIAGLIEDVRAEAAKGVRAGRVESYTSIRAGGTDTYRPLEFSGGSYADVYVEGSGASDLNLFVRDSKGRLVCSDTDISAIAYCGWQPDSPESFAVEVQNRGRAASAYKLMTN